MACAQDVDMMAHGHASIDTGARTRDVHGALKASLRRCELRQLAAPGQAASRPACINQQSCSELLKKEAEPALPLLFSPHARASSHTGALALTPSCAASAACIRSWVAVLEAPFSKVDRTGHSSSGIRDHGP